MRLLVSARRTLHCLLLTIAGSSLVAAGCSDSGDPTTPPPTQKNTDTIPVALVVSLSGPAAALGEEAKRGAEVAVAQLNAYGGVLSKRIELVVENDNSVPAITRQKVTELAARGVTLGIGPSTSTTALELKDLTLQDKILYISPSATSRVLDKLTDAPTPTLIAGEAPPTPVFLRTAATDIFLSAALTQYASNPDETGARRCPAIVLLQQNDTYGVPIGEAVEQYYRRFSLDVRRKIDLDPSIDNTAKLTDAATAAGGTLNAQCQLVVAQPEVAAAYMRAFKLVQEQKPDTRKSVGGWEKFLTIGSDGFRQGEFIAAGRVNPADTSSPTAGEGSIAVAADTSPAAQEYSAFLNLFKARFPNLDPGRYGSTAYDAMIMLAIAIERAQTTTDHKLIRSTLYKLTRGRVVGPNRLSDLFDLLHRGEDINYEGASGPLDFSPEGHVLSAFGVWKIEKAQFVRVGAFQSSELSQISP